MNSGTGRSIVLIGFMGSGKSSVARELEKLLGLPACDFDIVIEKREGRTVAAIFRDDGEEAFRRIESQCLHELLAGPAARIVATGGGIVKSAANRDALRRAANAGSVVAYLRATTETLAARIRLQPGARPLIDGDRLLDAAETRERVAQLMSERAAWYEGCATSIIDTDALTSAEVARAIAAAVAAPRCDAE